MESMIIAATKSTPRVHFDAQSGILCLQGESYPENAFEFYAPLSEWVGEYLDDLQGHAVLELRLTYLNTSSTRCMLQLIDTLDVAFQHGKAVEIRWYYHPEDDRSLEAGEEFQEDLSVPFTLIECTEDPAA